MEKQPVRKTKSSIYNIPTNIMAMLVLVLTAAFAWIPVAGYFAWIIPMVIFVAEKRSNFVRFYAAEALCIGIARLLINVVFDSIYNVALRTVDMYGQNADFIKWWGDISAPGHTAHTLSIAFSVVFTVICLYAAIRAYFKKMSRLPVASEIAEYMIKEFKPVVRHSKYKEGK